MIQNIIQTTKKTVAMLIYIPLVAGAFLFVWWPAIIGLIALVYLIGKLTEPFLIIYVIFVGIGIVWWMLFLKEQFKHPVKPNGLDKWLNNMMGYTIDSEVFCEEER